MSSDLIGVIPCAGKGGRLGLPIPKELMPLGHYGDADQKPMPMGDHILEQILDTGCHRVNFVVGPDKWPVVEHYGYHPKWASRYIPTFTYQMGSLGTGQAIAGLSSLVNQQDIVLYGMPDTLIAPNPFGSLVEVLADGVFNVAVTLFPTNRPDMFGTFKLDGTSGRAYLHKEKAIDGYNLMWGACAFGWEMVDLAKDLWSSGGWWHYSRKSGRTGKWAEEFTIDDVFDACLAEGMLIKGLVYESGLYVDAGTPEGYKRALDVVWGR